MAKGNGTLVVHSTKDYSRFKVLYGNRRTPSSHIRELVKSMEEQQLIIPATVNEKMEVIDGQHRLRACELLELPFYYVIQPKYGLDEVRRINSNQKNWSVADYAESYVKKGKDVYKKYRDFLRRYGFTHTASIAILTDTYAKSVNGTELKAFKDGLLEIPNYSKACRQANMIFDFSPYYEGYRRKCFVLACLKMFNLEGYNHKHMKRQFKQHGESFRHEINVTQYVKALEKLYSRGQANRILAFYG